MISISQFSLSIFILAVWTFQASHGFTSPVTTTGVKQSVSAQQLRQEWIDKSLNYYTKVMREERRKNMGQISDEVFESVQYQDDFEVLAKKHYFAYRKIKEGQHHHAERIYRKIINEIRSEEEEEGHCDHAKLAVTTLLLALHCQRMGDMQKTRDVFRNFFRVAVIERDEQSECACSAKVLGAYALFEMKQGNVNRSLVIVQKAVEFDSSLKPVLEWKQFREAERKRREKRAQLLQRKQLRQQLQSLSP